MLTFHDDGRGRKKAGHPGSPSSSPLAYHILDIPPWYLCIIMGVQVMSPSRHWVQRASASKTSSIHTQDKLVKTHTSVVHILVFHVVDFQGNSRLLWSLSPGIWGWRKELGRILSHVGLIGYTKDIDWDIGFFCKHTDFNLFDWQQLKSLITNAWEILGNRHLQTLLFECYLVQPF